MKKLMIAVAAGALAVTLAACGGSSTANTSSTASGATSVLESTSGMALYTPSGESATNVRCTGACAAIWKPLRPGAAKLAGAAVITRPDGSKQLAVAGKPLYTFVQDMAGTMNGNGATDAFSGKQFTWHVVSSAGKTAVAAPTPSGGGSGSSGGY